MDIYSWVTAGVVALNLFLVLIVINRKNKRMEMLMNENIDLTFKLLIVRFELATCKTLNSLKDWIEAEEETEEEVKSE